MVALSIAEIVVDQIVTDETRRQPTRGLIESMARHGLLQPLDVRSREDGAYDLVDGSRRLASARALQWQTVAAVVEPRAAAGPAKDLKAILLNTQRQNLRQLHVARHVRRHLRESDSSQAEMAREIGRGKSTLCAMLKVLACPDLEAAVERGELEFGAAKALSGLLPAARRALLAEINEIARREGELPSVRRVEALVSSRRDPAPPVEIGPEHLASVMAELQDRGAAIEIQVVPGKQSRLKVTITLAESDRLALQELLGSEPAASAPGDEECRTPAAAPLDPA